MKKGVKKATIVRTLLLSFALVNQMLVICGHSPLPFTEEAVREGVSMAITAGASLWTWWKNNSFTKAAIEADKVMEKMKKEEKETWD